MGAGRPPIPLVYRFVALVMRPLLRLLLRYEVHGAENIPPEGGFIAAVNHNSHSDPFPWAHVLYDRGIPPVFLAKDTLFKVPVIAWVMRSTNQVKVERERASAAQSLPQARAALAQGHCLGIYPEGSLTRDPDEWPMRGKTGAARLALESGCPVIPVAHWGAQGLLPPYARVPRIWRRHTVHIRFGEPVDLADLREQPMSSKVVATATDRVMRAITDELGQIRGLRAPEERFDPKAHGMTLTGRYTRGDKS